MNIKYYQINGKIKKSDEALISVDDYGLMRGYGIFETIRFNNKKVLKINRHIDRLYKGLSIIKINIGQIEREKLIADINNLVKINDIDNGLIKLVITKGTPGTSSNLIPNIYITIKNIYKMPKEPVKVVFLDESKYPIVRFSPSFKGINYVGNMMAIDDAQNCGAFECVFVNDNKNITECAMRNIFFIKNQTLITPALHLGILSGTTRSEIQNLAKLKNIDCEERVVHETEINTMDEAFLCSSAIGILSCYWDGWKSDYKITKKLQFLLEESLQK